MADEERRSHWDFKYEQGLPFLTIPDPFFLTAFRDFVEVRFPRSGVALDLAAGLGRHALWLAERRWKVTAVDISKVAIRKLRQRALQLDLVLDLFALDAAEYGFPPAQFDLIVLYYHLDRDLCPRMVSALKPGGVLLCKSSVRWNSDRVPDPFGTGPLERNEILSLFPEMDLMYHEERAVHDRGVVEFVGCKPAEPGTHRGALKFR